MPARSAHASLRTRLASRVGRRARQRLVALAVVPVCAVYLLPLVFTIVTSTKPASEARGDPFALPSRVEWSNYSEAFEAMDYMRSLFNSLSITAGASVLTVLLGSLAAYPLARYARRWTKAVYFMFGFGLAVPVFALITPLFFLLRDLGLLNTHVGVILIYTSLNLPLAVFFYTSFLRSVPLEIEDAARIDGCGPWRAFWLIAFPLLKPATATLAVFVVMGTWNDIVVPLVFFTDPSRNTIVRAALSFVGTQTFDPSELFPAVVLAILPLTVVFIVLQKRVVEGIAGGAVKG